MIRYKGKGVIFVGLTKTITMVLAYEEVVKRKQEIDFKDSDLKTLTLAEYGTFPWLSIHLLSTRFANMGLKENAINYLEPQSLHIARKL